MDDTTNERASKTTATYLYFKTNFTLEKTLKIIPAKIPNETQATNT